MIQAHKDPGLPPSETLTEGADWANTLTSLDKAQAETLVMVLRTLFPHDALADGVYRRTIHKLDLQPNLSTALGELLAAVDGAMPVPFRDCAETYRVAIMQSIEQEAFFRAVQPWAVRYFYDDIEVWQAFGYEGASHHLGGYVQRGFDDLDWLPEIPKAEETGS